MRTTVAIVGGGLSGLYAARMLKQAGFDFEIVEARDRFGGRILSVNEGGRPSQDGFDLGPSWYWPAMHPRMARIVEELGLRGFPQFADGDVLLERSSREMPQRYPTMRQEPQSMRLEGGTGAIVGALVRDLPAGHLHLQSRVTQLALRPDGVVLRVDRHGTDEEISADHVIVALPPRLFASTMACDPPLERRTLERCLGTATWMAPHAKFLALYDDPFWRQAGLSGTAQSGVGPLAEIHDASTASGRAALFGFVGLPGRQRSVVGEDALVDASIAQLVRLFGPRAAHPKATLLKDWSADNFTATDADEHAEGHPVPSHEPWIGGDWARFMSLAGSETSATEPGYLAGALDAAGRAVAETVRRMRSADAGGSGRQAR